MNCAITPLTRVILSKAKDLICSPTYYEGKDLFLNEKIKQL